MEFFLNNWYIFVSLGAVVGVAVYFARQWFKKPKEERRAILREKLFPKINAWLRDVVQATEEALGSGTGQKKLAMAYGYFCNAFPWAAKIMPFALFMKLVDDALKKVEGLLKE